jgi:hypothetical protein
MQNFTLVQQIFIPPSLSETTSILEATFDAMVSCKDCLVNEPLFGRRDAERHLQLIDESFFDIFIISKLNIVIISLVENQELEPGSLHISVAYIQDGNDKQVIFVIKQHYTRARLKPNGLAPNYNNPACKSKQSKQPSLTIIASPSRSKEPKQLCQSFQPGTTRSATVKRPK